MTYGHLQADCLYTGISPGPTLGVEYGKPLPLPFFTLYRVQPFGFRLQQVSISIRTVSTVCQCRDKSGTPRQNRNTWASRKNCDFFVRHVVKNRDCTGKSGTDGHLNHAPSLSPSPSSQVSSPSPTHFSLHNAIYCTTLGRLHTLRHG